MKTFRIYTPLNNYTTDSFGHVLTFSGNGFNKVGQPIESLKTWKITGIREIKPFGRLGNLITLDQAVKLTSFRFKNGKPKYAICDIDHGTPRVHGNFTYHGCIGVTKIPQ